VIEDAKQRLGLARSRCPVFSRRSSRILGAHPNDATRHRHATKSVTQHALVTFDVLVLQNFSAACTITAMAMKLKVMMNSPVKQPQR
jgi:hypothetical protein